MFHVKQIMHMKNRQWREKMSKLIRMSGATDKKELEEIAERLEELKDTLAGKIEEYEDGGMDSRKLDTLTEALDALEDALDAITDVTME